MDDLVATLSSGYHPLVAARADSSADLARSIEIGYVLLRFTGTRGGTELGVELDRQHSVLGDADFVQGRGLIRLAGRLTLNDESVGLEAVIDLATLRGEGKLTL